MNPVWDHVGEVEQVERRLVGDDSAILARGKPGSDDFLGSAGTGDLAAELRRLRGGNEMPGDDG